MISVPIGKLAWLSRNKRTAMNRTRNNKKMVRMISAKVCSVRAFSSFSKGMVALEPQAGQVGMTLFLGKQYPCPQSRIEFGKKFLVVPAF
jgi:hypothetical protein